MSNFLSHLFTPQITVKTNNSSMQHRRVSCGNKFCEDQILALKSSIDNLLTGFCHRERWCLLISPTVKIVQKRFPSLALGIEVGKATNLVLNSKCQDFQFPPSSRVHKCFSKSNCKVMCFRVCILYILRISLTEC